MDDQLRQGKESWDQTADSDWYRSLRTDEKIQKLVQNPQSAFHPEVYRLLQKYLPDMRGKKVLLPSSGDNHAAFALALLGAQVVSADISERQLGYAQQIASRLNLAISFICDDTARLSKLDDACFDLVYTSNGTHTWIADIAAMYQNIHRVLKPTEFSIMYDIHPFQRPFTGEPWKAPQIAKPYAEIMPHCHWRVQDLLNATLGARLSIKEVCEMQAVDASFWFSYEELVQQDAAQLSGINDWKRNPMAALPAWISIVSQK